MAEPAARFYLLSPLVIDPAAFAPRLADACAVGVAAVLLRLAPADERTLVKHVKALAPVAQDKGAAVVIATSGEADLAAVAVRGGADGVHTVAGLDEVRGLRERLKGDRIVGAGSIRSKHEAMMIGEAGVDYIMFGEPRADGSLPRLESVVERAAWWAEIFETPCVAYAPDLDAVPDLARTGAEFIALGEAVWTHPDGPATAVAVALDRCVVGTA